MGTYKGKLECPGCHHTSMMLYHNDDDSQRASCTRPGCGLVIVEFKDGVQCEIKTVGNTETQTILKDKIDLGNLKEESKGRSIELIPIEDIKPLIKTHRSISPSTFAVFNYGGYRCNGIDYQVASTYNEFKQTQTQNVRYTYEGKKRFFRASSPSKDDVDYLFGQYSNQTMTAKKMLVITEGEIDAMSVYEAYAKVGTWIPYCVSLPGGAGSVNVLAEQRPWLNQFEEIYLCFDADEAGQEAVKKAIKILGTEKIKEVKLKDTYKDANGYLTSGVPGAVDDLRFAINNATSPAIPCIIKKQGLVKLLDEASPALLPTDIPVLDELLDGGLTYGGINTLVGGVALGKSTLAYNIASNVLKRGGKVLILNTEMKNLDSLLHILSAYHKINYYDMFTSAGGTKEEVKQWLEYNVKDKLVEMLEGDRLAFFDSIETTPWEEAFNNIKALVEVENTSLIVLDNLTALSSTTSTKKQLIDTVIKDLNNLSRSNEVCTLAVSHLTKNGGGMTSNKDGSKGLTFETGAEVGLDNIADSSHIPKYSSTVLAYERNCNDTSGVLKLRLLKSRQKGVGKVKTAVYDKNKCTFTDMWSQPVFEEEVSDEFDFEF